MGCVCVCVLSRVWLFTTSWTVAHQAPLSMGFPRQENWSYLTFPSPGDLPDPGIKPASFVSPTLCHLESHFYVKMDLMHSWLGKVLPLPLLFLTIPEYLVLMRFGYLIQRRQWHPIEIGSIWIVYLIKMLFENKTEDCYMIVRNTSSFTTKEPFLK